ncbi:VF530 family DNA-binding protein [Vogesella oryzae]|uniref:VF530 family protein n=1 Tax=Vogesella oryzae TaxID=1735285 RepID=UPI001583FAAE|nr:VF530 family protein [Vogesella oryzae]
MTDKQANNPLHGITLEAQLTELVRHYGWPQLGQLVKIRCFNSDPSIKSSLTFLRRTPWAREQVEALYLRMVSPKPAATPRGPAPRVLFAGKSRS